MAILSTYDIEKLTGEFEKKGEKQVRLDLANNIYGTEERKSLAENWLQEKLGEKKEAKNKQEAEDRKIMKQKEDERFQAQLAIAKSQANSAQTSAWWAKFSAIIAAISAIISIIIIFHH